MDRPNNNDQAASVKVAHVYELLEQIFVNLDLPTLLVASQVSDSWQDIITKSRRVRRHLVEGAYVHENIRKQWSPTEIHLPWAAKASLANGWLFIYKLLDTEILLFSPLADQTGMKVLDGKVMLVHESGVKYGWRTWWQRRVPYVDSRYLSVTHPSIPKDFEPVSGNAPAKRKVILSSDSSTLVGLNNQPIVRSQNHDDQDLLPMEDPPEYSPDDPLDGPPEVFANDDPDESTNIPP